MEEHLFHQDRNDLLFTKSAFYKTIYISYLKNYISYLKNDAINFDKARIFQSLESVKSISLDAYSRTLAKNCQLFRHTVKAIKSSKQFKHCEKITGEILASVSDRIDGGCIDIARDSSSGSYEFSNLLSLLGI